MKKMLGLQSGMVVVGGVLMMIVSGCAGERLANGTAQVYEGGTRACTDCNSVPGLAFNPGYLKKGLIALALGTALFFVLLFAYKFWSFAYDVPYHLSTYYGGSEANYGFKGGKGNKKHLFKSRSNSGSMFFQRVVDAIDKYF